MRTINLTLWGACIVASGFGFMAVSLFNWEPSPHVVAATAFAAAFYTFGARFRLAKANLE